MRFKILFLTLRYARCKQTIRCSTIYTKIERETHTKCYKNNNLND